MARLKIIISFIVLLLIAAIVLQFMSANQDVVNLQTLVGDFSEVPISQVVLWAFVGGATIGFLVGFLTQSTYYFSNIRLKKQLSKVSSDG